MTVRKKSIAVMFGGRSVEHEISIISGLQLIQALDTEVYDPVPVYVAGDGRWFSDQALLQREFYRKLPSALDQLTEVTVLPKPGLTGLTVLNSAEQSTISVDLFLLCFHGEFGEDGCIQGLLELADQPYTGCNVPASAIAMNKYLCKSVLRDHGIPVLPSCLVHKDEVRVDPNGIKNRIFETLGHRTLLFVKPCNLGSSIGIGRADSAETLMAAIANACRFDSQVLIEPCVAPMFEINISVLDGNPCVASVVEIPASSTGVLTYEDKYLSGAKKGGTSEGMASLVRAIDPADLDPTYKERVTEYALKAFRILGCSGVVRFDFIVNSESGEIFFNELNTLPGSLAFYLWEKSQPRLLYTELLNQLISRAQEIYATNASLRREIGFKALFK